MDSSHPFVVRYKYVQIKKNGVVVTFVSLFCALCMFIKQLASDAHIVYGSITLLTNIASVGVTPRIFPTFTIAEKQEELESSVLQ